MLMYAEPPQTITFRKKQYDIYGVYDRKHKVATETEGLHAQDIKTHIVPWNTTHYALYTLETRK